LLFSAANDTLTILAKDILGARLGVTAVLHTWTREMLYHPHVHCIVTAGGLSLCGTRWVERTKFLFPAARMKALFRARILAGLQKMRDAGELTLVEEADGPNEQAWTRLIRRLPPKKKWVVYVEAPFGRSTHLLKYLGRYTHRIAISDQRMVSFDERGICFRTRDGKTITLEPMTFIGRFLQHVLPRGLHRIRHFGLYASANSKVRLPRARELLGEGDRGPDFEDPPEPRDESWLELLARLIQGDPLICPHCGVGRLLLSRLLPPLKRSEQRRAPSTPPCPLRPP
jgi:hypothetical protein